MSSFQQEDTSRATPARLLLGGLFLLFGSTFVEFALLYLGLRTWRGPAGYITPARALTFLAAGMALGSLGYRLLARQWAGVLRFPHLALGLAGVLFLSVAIRREARAPRPPGPPGWMLAIAVLAPLSCWVAKRQRARRRSRAAAPWESAP